MLNITMNKVLFHGKGNRILQWNGEEDGDSQEEQAGRGSASQEESNGQPGLGKPGHVKGVGTSVDEGFLEFVCLRKLDVADWQ